MTAAGRGSADRGRSPEVVEALRDAIIDGDFAPGQRLVEAELSERFGVNRAYVRNALLQLTSEGLVERIPNRGARVRAISLEEAIEITEVRMALEGLCAAKAAEHATADDRRDLREIGARMRDAVAGGDMFGYSDLNKRLHERVLAISGQNTARGVLARLRGQNVRRQFRLAMHPGRPATSLPQHLEIIEAVCAGDPRAAETAMRAHLHSVIDALPEVETPQARRLDAR